ncbi:MAG: hypothetical protein IKY52_09380 [Clostridia bacterium]|nr:hypothetical protein [Clostridia bacterium]
MRSMKSKKYTFGGVTFEVEYPDTANENDNCAAFLSGEMPDYRIQLCIRDDISPGNSCVQTGNVITKFMKSIPDTGINTASVLAGSKAAFLFLNHDAFILHASYIVHNGQAILFTAPSGTGKSTQADYWKDERGAEIINGDRVLVTRRNGQFYANGIYASGTSGICKNHTAPIRAIVLLEQGESNTVNAIPPRMMFLRILCECSYDLNDTVQCAKITELAADMINSVTTLCYRCKKSPDAVGALERILWNRE